MQEKPLIKKSFMSERREDLYIRDIWDSIIAIESYILNLAYEEFVVDRKSYSATIREFQIIGDAIKHLSDETLSKYPNIEWQDIKDFRNLLVHEYFGIGASLECNS